jgi:hypothetical protein
MPAPAERRRSSIGRVAQRAVASAAAATAVTILIGCTPIGDVIYHDVVRCIERGGGTVAADAELIFDERGEAVAFDRQVDASEELLRSCFDGSG